MTSDHRTWTDVYIALGSNLGDRRAAIEEALEAVDALATTELVVASDLYETKARFVEQQPDFLNACAHLRTGLDPHELLKTLLAIEADMGRVRDERHGPRVIDLDILFYGDQIIDAEGLIVPHRDLHNRRFVLEPLCEIAPEVVHPRLGETVRELLGRL